MVLNALVKDNAVKRQTIVNFIYCFSFYPLCEYKKRYQKGGERGEFIWSVDYIIVRAHHEERKTDNRPGLFTLRPSRSGGCVTAS